MTKTTTIVSARPPKHLSAEMRKWWRAVERDHLLEDHHRHLLRLACEAFDRAQEARKALDKGGLTLTDRFGQPKARPEASVERDCRRDFAKLVAQLDFDAEPPV